MTKPTTNAAKPANRDSSKALETIGIKRGADDKRKKEYADNVAKTYINSVDVCGIKMRKPTLLDFQILTSLGNPCSLNTTTPLVGSQFYRYVAEAACLLSFHCPADELRDKVSDPMGWMRTVDGFSATITQEMIPEFNEKIPMLFGIVITYKAASDEQEAKEDLTEKKE